MKNSEILIMTREDLDEFGENLTAKIVSQFPKQENAQPAKEQPKYYTRKETAAKLKCSYPKLWAMTKEGQIDAYKLGRKVLYLSTDVEGIIQKLNLKPKQN